MKTQSLTNAHGRRVVSSYTKRVVRDRRERRRAVLSRHTNNICHNVLLRASTTVLLQLDHRNLGQYFAYMEERG